MSNIVWNDYEMHAAILQILADARQKKPKTGGASSEAMADILGLEPNNSSLLQGLDLLLETKCIEQSDKKFQIAAQGFNRLA